MKKLMALGGIILAAATAAPALSMAEAGMSKGVKLGLNIATLYGADSEIAGATKGSRVGIAAGIFGTFGLPALPLAIEIDGLYSMKGAKYSDGGDSITVQYDYLDIPVLLQYDIVPAPIRFSLYAGPSLGILLDAAVADDVIEVDITDFTSAVDFGLVFGAGIGFPGGFSAEVRYDLGLTSVDDPPAGFEEGKDYNSVISLMVGYSF